MVFEGDPFSELDSYDGIIAYDGQRSDVSSFEEVAPRNFVLLDLSISPKIKKSFITLYGISKLPCMLYYGTKIYDCDELSIKRLEDIKFSYYRGFIDGLVRTKRVFLFMKGTADCPKCKYSKELIHSLESNGIVYGESYDGYDILENEDLRSEIKLINRWKTFPQIYVNGIFVGGLDAFKERLKEEKFALSLKGKDNTRVTGDP